MLETFSTKAVQLIDEAKQLAKQEMETSGTNLVVTTYHLLLSMFLANDTICHFLLGEEEIVFEELVNAYKEVSFLETLGNVFTEEFEEIVVRAATIAKEVASEYVYDEHLFYAILEYEDNTANYVLRALNLNIESLKQDVEDIFSFYNTEPIIYQSKKSNNDLKYLIDLSSEEHQHPYIGRNTYIDQMIYILNKRQKNNPLIIGSAGVGKTALVEGLTKIIDKKIFQLDLGGMIAGTKYRGEMEEKIINAVDYVHKNNGILFIDEIHNIVGAGSNDGSLDAANVLKPYLSKGSIQIIAATTLDEYYTYMEKDKALIRRFQNIFIDEPNVVETINILKGIRPKYEEYYHVKISDDLIEYIVKTADENILTRKFPDKAIDVLDETLSRYKFHNMDLKKLVNKVIEGINGISVPSKEQLLDLKLHYDELVSFYLRKVYPLKINKNLGVIKVGKEFKLDLLVSDMSKVFNLKQEMVLSIDLADYQTPESIHDLIGSSKGYVGYEQGGFLYNHLLKYPLNVIFLKNFDVASAYLKNFFMVLFRKKFVIDSHSRYIYLKNTLFIIRDSTNNQSIGFVKQQMQKDKYYDYYLKKNIYQENLEMTSYLLKKGIIIEGFKALKEQDQINLFYHAINKPMGKYKIKYDNDILYLETVPS